MEISGKTATDEELEQMLEVRIVFEISVNPTLEEREEKFDWTLDQFLMVVMIDRHRTFVGPIFKSPILK